MTKKTDDKNTKDDDKDLENEEADNESEEDEDEEDEETSDEEEDEDDDDDDDDDDEEEAAAPAKPSGGKAAEHRRPRHEEYLAGDEASGGPAEDPTWWAPHAVLGVLVLLGVLGFLGVFNKALGFLAPKGAETTAEQKSTTARPGSSGQPTAQQPQAPREMFGAKHLLVMYKGSKRAPATIERTKEEAKARATEAAKKAKADPGKFADLVKEYSDEPGAGDRGGDLGKFPKGAMVPEFQAGLEKIKVGEISDVVESAFGFHVILRTQ